MYIKPLFNLHIIQVYMGRFYQNSLEPMVVNVVKNKLIS